MGSRLLGCRRRWRVGSALGRSLAQSPAPKFATVACRPSLSLVPVCELSCTRVWHVNPREHTREHPTSVARRRGTAAPVSHPVRDSVTRDSGQNPTAILAQSCPGGGPAAHFTLSDRVTQLHAAQVPSCSNVSPSAEQSRECLHIPLPGCSTNKHIANQQNAFANQRSCLATGPPNTRRIQGGRVRSDAGLGSHCAGPGL